MIMIIIAHRFQQTKIDSWTCTAMFFHLLYHAEAQYHIASSGFGNYYHYYCFNTICIIGLSFISPQMKDYKACKEAKCSITPK